MHAVARGIRAAVPRARALAGHHAGRDADADDSASSPIKSPSSAATTASRTKRWDSTIDRLACGFLESGIRPQDRVVVQLPNVPAFVYTYFALTRIGAIPVTALRAHRHTEVRHFLRASGAVAYVIPDVIKGFDYRAMAQELAPQAPALRTVFVAGEPAPGQRSLSALLDAPLSAAAAASALAGHPPRSGRSHDDAAVGRNHVTVEADSAHP